MIFVTSVVITRLVVIPLEEAFGSKYILISPSLPISTALRLSWGGLLLGLSVVARYIGPQSVGKFSRYSRLYFSFVDVTRFFSVP